MHFVTKPALPDLFSETKFLASFSQFSLEEKPEIDVMARWLLSKRPPLTAMMSTRAHISPPIADVSCKRNIFP